MQLLKLQLLKTIVSIVCFNFSYVGLLSAYFQTSMSLQKLRKDSNCTPNMSRKY